MNALGFSLVLIGLSCGCSKPPATVSPPVALPARLEEYFKQYCNDTGSLGIGFVAWHTYDYRFRQHLKQTQDPELKRLYVLRHLHGDVDWSLRDFEAGIIRTGKTSSRPLTLPEWQAARRRLLEQIEDLDAYAAFTNFVTISRDPFDHPDPVFERNWIEELRKKVSSITNAPEANNHGAANGSQPIRSESISTSSAAGARR